MFGELHTFQQLVYCTYQNYVSYFVYFLEYLNYLDSWIPCVFFRDITLLHEKKKSEGKKKDELGKNRQGLCL